MLEGRRLKEVAAEPRRDARKLRVRTTEHELVDGMLCRRCPELGRALPVVPEDVPYRGSQRMEDAPGAQTWKHFLLAAVHAGAAHQSAR